ncbi:hypothetical protein SAMN04487981_12752 [Streptomyces sp. cf386]|nr:hypothetical protein SAMN04487981_12752 [Streptomyces sp. cf386]
MADAAAASVRIAAGRNPRDKGLTDLIGELVTRGDAFNRRWSTHNVRLHRSGTKHIHHPDVGDLEFVYEVWSCPITPDGRCFAYPSAAGSATEERVKLLGSLASTPSEASASSPEN